MTSACLSLPFLRVLCDLPASPKASQGTQPAPAASGEEDWLDAECLRECAGEADERISLDSVRRALAKIPGSLTADFVQERADR